MAKHGRARREELGILCRKEGWYRPEFFQELARRLPPEIAVIDPPPGQAWQFNCYAYALGLHTLPAFFKTGIDGFIYSSFVKKLFMQGELVKTGQFPEAGDLIFYASDDMLKHAGIVSNDHRIISKWAAGPLLKHEAFDVPISYGNFVFYCKPLWEERVHRLYDQYKCFNVRE
jgi:hypothetical protein